MYQFLWLISWPFIGLVYPRKTIGRENIPEGAAIVCANHSSAIDPFLMTHSLGRGTHLRFMAKVEIFRVPIIGPLLRAAGIFPVDRKGGGAMAIKGAMKLLKSGEKVAMFPEGTRVSTDEESEAKVGAVRLAAKLDVPIVPVYIPREKRLFRRMRIVIGAPYMVEVDPKTAKSADYEVLAGEMMEKIRLLGTNIK